MTHVICLRGIPGSGKTTWARSWIKEHPSYVRVNRDDIRNMLGEYWVPRREKLVTKIETQCVLQALKGGYNVILDATNISKNPVNRMKGLIGRENIEADIEVKEFIIDVEQAVICDSLRENPVGREVIQRMYDNLNNLKQEIKQDEQ